MWFPPWRWSLPNMGNLRETWGIHECSWMWKHTKKKLGPKMPAKCGLVAACSRLCWCSCMSWSARMQQIKNRGTSFEKIMLAGNQRSTCAPVSNYHQTCPVSSSSIFPLDRNPPKSYNLWFPSPFGKGPAWLRDPQPSRSKFQQKIGWYPKNSSHQI